MQWVILVRHGGEAPGRAGRAPACAPPRHAISSMRVTRICVRIHPCGGQHLARRRSSRERRSLLPRKHTPQTRRIIGMYILIQHGQEWRMHRYLVKTCSGAREPAAGRCSSFSPRMPHHAGIYNTRHILHATGTHDVRELHGTNLCLGGQISIAMHHGHS